MLALLFLLVAATSWWITAPGMVVTPDSSSYLSTAVHLARGEGLTSDFAPDTSNYSIAEQLELARRVPLTEWPPLYPAVLAGGTALGPGALDVARIVHALAVAATAVLAALLVRRAVAPPPLVLAASGLLAVLGPVQASELRLLSVPLLGQSAFVLSETLFVPLLLAALLVGAQVARGGRRTLLAAVVLVVAATLTRYVGVAAGAGAAAMVLAATGVGRRRRLRRAAALLVAGPVAAVTWTVVRELLWRAGGGEELAWHPPGSEALGDLLDVAGAWFLLPEGWPAALRVPVLLIVVAVPVASALNGLRRRGRARDESAAVLVGLLTAASVLFGVLVVTMALVDVNVPFAQRTLAPVQVLLQLAWVCVGYRWAARRAGPAWVPTAAVVVGALVLCAGSVAGLRADREAIEEAARTTAEQRASSPLRELPPDVVVVTNEPARAWGETSAQVLLAPRERRMVSGEADPEYEGQLREVDELLARRAGVVAIYPGLLDGGLAADLQEVGLERLEDCGDTPELLGAPGRAREMATLLRC